MRFWRFFFTAAFLLVYAKTAVFADAAATPDSGRLVRVGLMAKNKNSQNLQIDEKLLHVGFAGAQAGDLAHGAAVTARASFSVVPATASYIRISADFGSFEAAAGFAENAKNAGIAARIAMLDDDCFAVYAANAEFSSVSAKYPAARALPQKARVCLMDGENPLIVFDNDEKTAAVWGGEGTTLGTRRYRGVIELSVSGAGAVTPVNTLTMADYLRGVLPAEMPSDWDAEALKAQAVVCRSYAYNRMASGAFAGEGYDICDLSCQVYLGMSAENPRTDEALRETDGVIMYYDNAPAEAVYSASSGGLTADSSDVWGESVPYLRSVPEVYEPESALWERSYSVAELSSLSGEKGVGAVKAVSIDETNGGRVTKLTIHGSDGSLTLEREKIRLFFKDILPSRLFEICSPDEKDALLAKAGYTPASAVSAPEARRNAPVLSVLSAAGQAALPPGGLFMHVRDGLPSMPVHADIQITNGAITIPAHGGASGESAQSPDNFGSFGDMGGFISSVFGETKTVSGDVVFVGRGNGHGAGFSQYGAKGMAELGMDFTEILRHYFTGVEIK
ncbi:MAG: SpoIID/LytB domain-containing protein [Clostridiales bacterium]|nr:SpoIID/LytB domain-containing protein [Clostridiales bacterium]